MKTNNSQDKNQDSTKLFIAVAASMVVVAAIWATYFFPKNSKENNYSLKSFAGKIAKSFEIFKNNSNITQQEQEQAEIEDLRIRVFGDKIER